MTTPYFEYEWRGQVNRDNPSTKQKQEQSKNKNREKSAISADSTQKPIPSNGKTLEEFNAGLSSNGITESKNAKQCEPTKSKYMDHQSRETITSKGLQMTEGASEIPDKIPFHTLDANAPEERAQINRDNSSTRSKQVQNTYTKTQIFAGVTPEKVELEDNTRTQTTISSTVVNRHHKIDSRPKDSHRTYSNTFSVPSDIQVAQKSEEHNPVQKRSAPTNPQPLTRGLTLKNRKELTDGAENQYIFLREPDAKGLPYSAKLCSTDLTWKLHGEECLVTIGNTFVARVAIGRIDELDAARDFYLARDMLIRNVRVEHVLWDETKQRIKEIVEHIKSELHNLKTNCTTDLSTAQCLLEMLRIAEHCGYNITKEFCKQTHSSKLFQNQKLTNAFADFFIKKVELQKRSFFGIGNETIENFLENSLNEIFEEHKKCLLKICSPLITPHLTNLKSHSCMLLRDADVRLFSDLERVLPETVLHEILSNFFERITDIKPSYYSQSLPVTNDVYLYICKSLIQIGNRVEMELAIMEAVEYDQNQWQMKNIENIKVESAPHTCFVSQLQMLVAFANHFEPGKSTVKDKFPYELQTNLFGNAFSVQGEQYLWHCLVDFTMINILQRSAMGDYRTIVGTFKKIITSEKYTTESHESLRILSHDFPEFVAQVENSRLLNISIGKCILRNQAHFTDKLFFNGEWQLNAYREAMDVFKNFWARWHDAEQHLLIKLASIYFRQKVEKILINLLCVASNVLEKHVSLQDIIRFFKSFNELLVDITELSFQWFVQIQNEKLRNILLKNRIIKRIENKQSHTKNACYRVEPGLMDKFTAICAQSSYPQHYAVEVITKLLNNIIEICQMKDWKNNKMILMEDKVNVTTQLINAVRGSLLYIDEQPNCTDFESFYEEFVNAFANVVKESDSLEDFSKRVSRINEIFWHFRKNEANVIEEMLPMISLNNADTNQENLKLAVGLYNETNMVIFKRLVKYANIKQFLEQNLGKVNPMVFSEWTLELKLSVIPKLLAVVEATWSTIVSKDISSLRKYWKLHTFQIFSIFRLLGVDQNTSGVENHLAQISTGQGKSTVLAFAATVLALLGHTVVIVCRNENSATKERNKYRELYQMLSVDSRISYKNVESMAWNQTQWIALKAEQYLCNSIGLRCTKAGITDTSYDLSKSVLLIDEIDAIFLDKFHENSYIRTFSPVVPGLGKVQQKIWELVQTNSVDEVLHEIACFVRSSTDSDVKQLGSLIDQQKVYSMFECIPEPSEVQYTNETLFSDHFKRMVTAAKTVHDNSTDESFFRSFTLGSNGILTGQWNQEVCQSDTYTGYIKTFLYFKLLEKNFIQNEKGVNKFGYLVFNVASYSYGKSLEKCSLILGVTGMLENFSSYENTVMKHYYGISRTFTMPSIFGESKLKFDEVQNFQCLSNSVEWRKAILSQINAAVSENRSVIVVFDTKLEVTQFRQSFEFQLDQLNGMATVSKVESEASHVPEPIARRTATLTTREMILKFDYRTSVSVESNGGVHVIQTFFSLDSKEESRIKALTARRGNRGSYELIVCRTHLAELDLKDVDEGSIDYSFLNNSRKRRAEVMQDIRAKQFERSNEVHDKTVRFWQNVNV